ncbi:MAG TPA: BON domain-containing protein [Pyrinomonadaceae bacterium]|nr:BON domain-containing protein [Pyrinomonadaceae bacterium]
MSKNAILVAALLVSLGAFAACNDTSSNTNTNTNTNTGTVGTRTGPEMTATPTPTPRYSEEQAREERERAKGNKETVGQSLEDAWVHAKVVAKLISDSQTPERKINVDVVDGVVTLRGQVDTAEGKTEAERLTKETDGVKSVKNELKVVPAKSGNTNANNKPAANKSKTSY